MATEKATPGSTAVAEPVGKGSLAGVGIGPLEEPIADDQTEAELEAEGTPAATATAPSTAAAPATQPEAKAPAPTPAAPPVPQVSPEIAQYQQLIQRQHAALQQAGAQFAAQRQAQEDAQTKAVLEGQGYTEEQIQQTLKQVNEVRQSQQRLTQERQAMHEYIAMQRADDQAKITVAQMLSQQYGMPFNDLMKISSPQLMEAKAEAHQAKQVAAKAQQAKVQPQKFASTAPGAASPMSYERLRERKVNGEKLTLEENKVLYPDRY